MVDLTSDDFEAAVAFGEARLRGPRAVSAHFDAGRNRVIIRLTTGIEIGLVPYDVEGLRDASFADLRDIEIDAFSLGIHFPKLDADLYVPALLDGVLGSQSWLKQDAPQRKRGGSSSLRRNRKGCQDLLNRASQKSVRLRMAAANVPSSR